VRRSIARAVSLGTIFIAISIFMAFPQIRQIDRVTPGDYADGYFTQWTVRWDFQAITGPQELFDANIFWPNRDTLAYSDTLLPAALIVGLLTPIFGSPTDYNLVYLATWVVSMIGMYLLAHRLTGNRLGAVLAAIVFTFSAPRLGQYVHFQLAFACLIPLCIYFLLRVLEEKKWSQAVALGVTTGMTGLIAGYYAVLLSVALPTMAVGWLVWDKKKPTFKTVATLGVAALLTALLMAPVAIKYLDVQQRLKLYRGPTEIEALSAHPKDFLAPARHSYLYGFASERPARRARDVQLFPGVMATILALVGVVALLRRSIAHLITAPHRRAFLLLILVGAIGFIFAFGVKGGIGETEWPLPYALLARLPLFSGIRSVSRFIILPLIAGAALTSFGFSNITSGRPRLVAYVLTAAIATIALAEYRIEINTVPTIDRGSDATVNDLLRNLPPGPVLELPMGDPSTVFHGYVEAPRMLMSIKDLHPRINGYSGFVPPGYIWAVESTNALVTGVPNQQAEQVLDRFAVRYLIIRTAPLTPEVSGAHPHLPGIGFYDAATAEKVVSALPQDRIVARTQSNGALLIQLRN